MQIVFLTPDLGILVSFFIHRIQNFLFTYSHVSILLNYIFKIFLEILL